MTGSTMHDNNKLRLLSQIYYRARSRRWEGGPLGRWSGRSKVTRMFVLKFRLCDWNTHDIIWSGQNETIPNFCGFLWKLVRKAATHDSKILFFCVWVSRPNKPSWARNPRNWQPCGPSTIHSSQAPLVVFQRRSIQDRIAVGIGSR